MKVMKKTGLLLMLTGFSFSVFANQVNLNTASKDELIKGLDGLTEKQAQAIIDYRDKEGAFVKIPELLHIGIGREIIEPNYNKLTVGNATMSDKKPDRLN